MGVEDHASRCVMIRNTPLRTATSMPLTIEGIEFFTTAEVTQMLSVSRQTLWRWRAEGDVPLGRRYRRKSVVFTKTEVDEIVAFANKIEPIAVERRSLDAGRLTDSEETM
jgi:predicted DNA-binding transcriptional regulator AlpA